MSKDIFEVINGENDETKLMLYASSLNVMKLKQGQAINIFWNPFNSQPHPEADVKYCIFNTSSLFDYKTQLTYEIERCSKVTNLDITSLLNQYKQQAESILNQLEDLNDVDYCYYFYRGLMADITNKIASSGFQEQGVPLYEKIKKLLSLSISRHQLRKSICVFLFTYGYTFFQNQMPGSWQPFTYTQITVSSGFLSNVKKSWESRSKKLQDFIRSDAFKNIDSDWLQSKVNKEMEKRKIYREPLLDLMCISEVDKKESAVVYINIFLSHGDTANLFLSSLKQKIAKDKYIHKTGKTVLNIRINEAIKSKLDELLEYYDRTQTNYLEMLINQDYEKIKKYKK